MTSPAQVNVLRDARVLNISMGSLHSRRAVVFDSDFSITWFQNVTKRKQE